MPPPYSIEGREVTRNMLDYTAHMYSSKEKTLARGRQGKEYTPHPLWLVLPDQGSEPPGKRRPRDTEAMLRSGGGVPGGRSRRHRGKNTVYFTYPYRPCALDRRAIDGWSAARQTSLASRMVDHGLAL